MDNKIEKGNNGRIERAIFGGIALCIASVMFPIIESGLSASWGLINYTKHFKPCIPLGIRNRTVWIVMPSGHVRAVPYIIAYRIRLQKGWGILLKNPAKWYNRWFRIPVKVKQMLGSLDSIAAVAPLIICTSAIMGALASSGLMKDKGDK
jgi:hypothetical protein